MSAVQDDHVGDHDGPVQLVEEPQVGLALPHQPLRMHDEEGAEGDAEEEGGVEEDGNGVSAEDEHTAEDSPVRLATFV